MRAAVVPGVRRRGPFVSLAVPAASVLILVLGWSSLWLFARQQAGSVMDAWIRREGERGRVWACPGRDIGGFPFRIVLACAGPSFKGRVEGVDLDAAVAGIRAETFLYEPSTVEISVEGPLAFRSDEARVNGTLAWSALGVTLRGLTAHLKRAAVLLEAPALSLTNGDGGRAVRVEAHLAPALGRPIEDDADDVRVTVEGASIPALDALTGAGDLLAVDLSAVVTRAAAPIPAPGAAMLEAWRAAGGIVDLSSLDIGKGAMSATVTGTLGLDAAHRLAGRLRAGASGVEPLAARFGIPLRVVTAGSVLATIFDRTAKTPPGAAPPAPGAVVVPVTLGEGRVSLGPFKTAIRLQPLY